VSAMLDTILIVNATMIVGALFAEAVGRAMGIKSAFGAARWMLIWGLVAVLPFSLSAMLAIFGYEAANWITLIGFIGFVTWFLVVSFAIGVSKGSGSCQFIVSEEELAGYLNRGYVVVAVLESGKVVIE
jgi:hypothetical protein